MVAEGGNVVRFTYTGVDDEVIPREATHILVQGKVIRRNAFQYHFNIVEVICDEDVEKIEQYAFYCCPSLKRVVLRGVKIVELRAFYDCAALEDVECDKLEIIGEGAFSWCESLKNINLPSARIVEQGAFACCGALTNVKFGSKIERIDENAFLNCHKLKRITIPMKDGLIANDHTFRECDDLHEVDLIEGELHETIASLQLEEWRNDMNEKIDSINQILPNAPAGDEDEDDPGEKTQAIRRWIRSSFSD